MTRNKLYTLLAIACFFGYAYFGFSIFANHYYHNKVNFQVCIFKRITSYPCPSCGTTRAVKFLADGEIVKSIMINPFGIIVGIIMLILPFWMAFDLILNRSSLLKAYQKTEKIIGIKWVAVLLILLVLLNWYWNIQKNL